MIPSLPRLIELHNSYYTSHQESRPRDEMESVSISPRAIKEPLQDGIKEYQFHEASENFPSIQRFVIDRDECTDYRMKEKDVFTKALEYLMSGEIASFEAAQTSENIIDPSNVVLVDIFTWENDVVKREKNGLPEFHSICLWKTNHSTVRVFDPNDLKKTHQQIKSIIEEVEPTIKVLYTDFGMPFDSVKEIRFYGSLPGLIQTPPYGTKDGMIRDSIDIAVKIAFALIEAQNECKSEKEVIDRIKLLSNQKINKLLVIEEKHNNACTGTVMRALQSSSREVRQGTLDWLQENAGICRYVAINRFKDLERIEQSNKACTDLISHPKSELFLKKVKRVNADQLEELSSLFKEIVQLEEKKKEVLGTFPLFEIQFAPSDEFNIQKFIPKEGSDSNWTQLHLAIINNDSSTSSLDLVKTVLQEYERALVGENKEEKMQKLVGAPDFHGQTALHWAASKGFAEVCKLLYTMMSPEQICLQTNNFRRTALHLAVEKNHIDVVKLLLSSTNKAENEKLAGIVDADGITALHLATQIRSFYIAELLYNTMTPDQICQQTKDTHETPLHFAVQTTRLDLIELFLSHKEQKVNQRLVGLVDINDWTALHGATNKGLARACKLIYNTMTPDQICQQTKDTHETPLHFAVKATRLDLIELLLSHKNQEVNERLVGLTDEEDNTPLHCATQKGLATACKLIYQKMTPEQICHQTEGVFQTALHAAVEINRPDIIRLLISHKESEVNESLVGLTNINDMTALHLAVKKGYYDICELLYNTMTPEQICHQMIDGSTLLHIAVEADHLDIVRLLISHEESEVNESLVGLTDEGGNTPLHLAVDQRCYDMCELLCQKMTPEQICQQTIDGQTALHIAVKMDDLVMVRLLINQNDKQINKKLVTLPNHEVETALECAKDKDPKILEVLQNAIAAD